MQQPVLFNRRLVSSGDALIPADSRAVALGEACFETLRVYPGGEVLGFAHHIARLMRGLDQLGYDAARHRDVFDPESAAADLFRLLEACRLTESSARVRIQAGRIDRNSIRDFESPADFFCMMTAAELKTPSQTVALHPGDFRRLPLEAADPSVKWSFYLPAVQALQQARAVGFGETLFWDAAGNLACGALSNIFLVSGSAVFTPALESGALHGITRALLIEALYEAGIPVREQKLSRRDLEAAEAVFLTNSVTEIAVVSRIGELHKATDLPMLQRITTIFDAYKTQNLQPLRPL
ncbi:MAG: aminotransferase class IV [Balneolales bacterium]|nr:aminotransferase class IV [Balneolales bacterium]